MLHILTVLTLATTAAAAVRGVSPQDQHLYAPNGNGKWHCLSDPSIELTMDQINDNYCDCPDGSDEPGTNACPYTEDSPKLFYCANEGFKAASIPNFKVNDGVCDYDVCCDGSDEYATGACVDKCSEVKAQYDAYIAESRAQLDKALAQRSSLEAKAAQLKTDVQQNVARLQEEVKQAAEKVENLEQELESAKEEGETDPLAFVTDAFSDQLSKVERKFAEFTDSAAKSTAKITQLEEMLHNLLENYNPNFNDQAVKQAVASYANYVSNKQEKESVVEYAMKEFSLDSLKEKLKGLSPTQVVSTPTLVPSFTNMLNYYYQKYLGQGVHEAAHAKPQTSSDKTRHLAAKLKDAEKELKDKKADLEFYENDLTQFPEEAEILRAMVGTWASKELGSYTYKVGFLNAIYQDKTLLGRFSGMTGHTMHFINGEKCWNGPRRSVNVHMVCGPENELMSVSEPEKCSYKFVVKSPFACQALSDDQIAESFVVDFEKLTS